jgi:hypothetical protein
MRPELLAHSPPTNGREACTPPSIGQRAPHEHRRLPRKARKRSPCGRSLPRSTRRRPHDRNGDRGIAAPVADRPESAGDVVEHLGDLVGGGEHRPVTGRKFTQVPVEISERRDARISLGNQLSNPGDRDPACRAEDRRSTDPWRSFVLKPQRRRESRVRLWCAAFRDRGEVLVGQASEQCRPRSASLGCRTPRTPPHDPSSLRRRRARRSPG